MEVNVRFSPIIFLLSYNSVRFLRDIMSNCGEIPLCDLFAKGPCVLGIFLFSGGSWGQVRGMHDPHQSIYVHLHAVLVKNYAKIIGFLTRVNSVSQIKAHGALISVTFLFVILNCSDTALVKVINVSFK